MTPWDNFKETMAEVFAIISEALVGLKTKIFSVAVIALGVISQLDPYLVSSIVPPEYFGWVLMGIGICTYLLRQVTKGPAKPLLKDTDDDDLTS